MGLEPAYGSGAPADQHRPASFGAFPWQRTDLKPRGLCQSLRLQEGRRDGARKILQDLVSARPPELKKTATGEPAWFRPLPFQKQIRKQDSLLTAAAQIAVWLVQPIFLGR